VIFTPLKGFSHFVLNLLFPPFCLGCGREGEFICFHCRPSLPYLQPPLCPRCGAPLPIEPCLCKGTKWEIEGIRSPFRFEGLIRDAIHQFKYQNLKTLAPPLAALLEEYLHFHPLPIEVIIPVPLHPKRLRQRGYNQAELLAGELAKLTRLPLMKQSLRRKRDTPPQIQATSAEERRANVADAFTCQDGQIQGKQVLLIDDVCTTGATLDACAKALKVSGATLVWGLTLAREI